MTRFVLDASVALRWFLDSSPPAYASRVKRVMHDGGRALVPGLWHLEMASGLVMAERRGVLTASDVDRSLADIGRLLTEWVETEEALVPVRQAVEVARPLGLSVYDGVYLDLARRERLPLASLDEKLRAAASRCGVGLLR